MTFTLSRQEPDFQRLVPSASVHLEAQRAEYDYLKPFSDDTEQSNDEDLIDDILGRL